jgi:hypothetical protein
VVINNFDIDGAGGTYGPFKANPPLVIDADAVLAPSVALEGFQPIAGQGRKVFQARRYFQPVQTDFRLSPETGKFPNVLPIGETFGFSVSVTHDHQKSLAVIMVYVKHK